MLTTAPSVTTNATVKRFHPVRGGFASSPAFRRELYVRPAVVAAAGLDRLVKDETIDVEASETAQGPEVIKILRRTDALVFHDAVIKSYFTNTAYGFAVLRDGNDVFVHKATLQRCQIDEAAIAKGVRVQVAYVRRDRGLWAISIRLA